MDFYLLLKKLWQERPSTRPLPGAASPCRARGQRAHTALGTVTAIHPQGVSIFQTGTVISLFMKAFHSQTRMSSRPPGYSLAASSGRLRGSNQAGPSLWGGLSRARQEGAGARGGCPESCLFGILIVINKVAQETLRPSGPPPVPREQERTVPREGGLPGPGDRDTVVTRDRRIRAQKAG